MAGISPTVPRFLPSYLHYSRLSARPFALKLRTIDITINSTGTTVHHSHFHHTNPAVISHSHAD